jgi:hypothetical protein
MTPSLTDTLDRLGIAASCACAIHCALTPLFVGFLSAVGTAFFVDERLEWVLIGFSVVVGILSLLPSYIRQHRQMQALVLFISGMLIVLAAQLSLDGYPKVDLIAVLLGASLIVSAHLVNRKLCRGCQSCPDNCTA